MRRTRRRRPRVPGSAGSRRTSGVLLGIAVMALLLTMGAQLLTEAWGDSLTFDEARYIQTGSCAYQTGRIDLEVSNPAGHKLLAGAGVQLSGQPAATLGRLFRPAIARSLWHRGHGRLART